MEDPFLNYFALGLLLFVVIVLFYGIIAIHDIPARIAHARHHPHEDAIHAAGWVSLFMLHVLWPFLWIWAMAYRPERGWGFSQQPNEPTSPQEATAELEELRHRLAEIEARLEIRKAVFDEGQLQLGSGSPGSVISAVERENVPAAGAAPAVSRGAQR
jgi:type VI protein secretion system component VasK